MDMDKSPTPPRSNFRHFFVRGLAIVLPSVLTIWILLAAYSFVSVRIAEPINRGIRELIVQFTDWPTIEEFAVTELANNVDRRLTDEEKKTFTEAGESTQWLQKHLQRDQLERSWRRLGIPLDLIGLVVAIIVIYILGGLLGSFIGRRLYQRGEEFISRIPLIRNVYPSVKQVTDFLVGGDDESKQRFSRVVAVQYPRKGLWSIALVTGETMKAIQNRAERPCVTLFVPSSPTPFTGYVITVPADETIDLPISIEDALRFTISGGVVIPPNQQITPRVSRAAAAATRKLESQSAAPPVGPRQD